MRKPVKSSVTIAFLIGILFVFAGCKYVPGLGTIPTPEPTPIVEAGASSLVQPSGGPTAPSDQAEAIAFSSSDSSALELFQQTVELQSAMKSFRAHMVAAIEVEGLRQTLDSELEVSEAGRAHVVANMDSFMGSMQFESIIAPPDAYIKTPEDGWVRMIGQGDLSAVEVDLLGSFSPMDELGWDMFSVRSLGTERIDGTEAEHLQVEVDIQRLWEQLAEESGDLFASMFTEEMTASVREMGDQTEFGLDLWVDNQGYARRTEMHILLGGEMAVDMTMRLYDIDGDIVVKLPRDYTEGPTGAMSILSP